MLKLHLVIETEEYEIDVWEVLELADDENDAQPNLAKLRNLAEEMLDSIKN